VGRGGDRFAPAGAGRLGNFGKPDRFDRRLQPDTGVYPRKGKGLGVVGEASYPDLLAQLDRNNSYASWRMGMGLPFNQLLRDRRQFLPVQVLDRPSWAPQEGWGYRDALLVYFPSKGSPEGRWTVTVKPRGSDIAPLPLAANAQWEVFSSAEDGRTLRVLEVNVGATWGTSALIAASGLIGELVEDSGIGPDAVVDEDGTLQLLCIGVYPEQGVMLFDGTQCWRRQALSDGRRVLRREVVPDGEPVPRFRVGRHLCQATTLSCNCPQYLGVEYARLRPNEPLGTQALFPTRGPASHGVLRPAANLAEELLAVTESELRRPDPLEGVARRFFNLSWQRLPEAGCKHIHAVRFSLGCPLEEPSDFISLASDYWDGVKGMASIEELRAPLASPRFVSQLRSTLLNEDAYAGLSSTMKAGSVGDAYSIVPGRLVLAPQQVNTILVEDVDSPFRRFNAQQATAEAQAAEEAVLGDLWVGRGTQAYNYIYEAPGVVLDEPFVTNGTAVAEVLP
jgi:hypothetical protein